MLELDKVALEALGAEIIARSNNNHLSGAKPTNCILTVRKKQGLYSCLVRVLWAARSDFYRSRVICLCRASYYKLFTSS